MQLTLWIQRLLALLLVVLMILLEVTMVTQAEGHTVWHYRNTGDSDIHGGVQMGVSNDMCDNAKDNLTVDWNNSEADYKCTGEHWSRNENLNNVLHAHCKNYDLDPPLHKCMSEPIHYSDPIPTAGAHRPLWAQFGEYKYLPKQRWIHNLEHGCAVFLYHPCADPSEVDELRQIARSCLRKHIITPFKELSHETPFAVVTYGCKLLLHSIDEMIIVQFLQEHAIDAPEKDLETNGQFKVGLETPAEVVSDMRDSIICPRYQEVPEGETRFEYLANMINKLFRS